MIKSRDSLSAKNVEILKEKQLIGIIRDVVCVVNIIMIIGWCKDDTKKDF